MQESRGQAGIQPKIFHTNTQYTLLLYSTCYNMKIKQLFYNPKRRYIRGLLKVRLRTKYAIKLH